MKKNPAPECRRIRLVRQILGYTQAEIAQRIGINVRQWSGYERGLNVPRDTVSRIEEYLDLSPEWVWFGFTGNLTPKWHAAILARMLKEPRPSPGDMTLTLRDIGAEVR